MEENEKRSKKNVKSIVVLIIVIIFIAIGSLAGILFPGTAFESVIDNSVGKFFDIISLVKNNYVHIIESVAIILFIYVLNYILLLLIKVFRTKGKRGETIGMLFTNITKYLSIVIGLLLILSAWGVQTPTLLAGAGIAGLAISFGAQGILEDVFAGLSIIFEKQFVVGDIVEVNGFRGVVLEVGSKNTRIKDIRGNVLIIANSDIREIVNLSAEVSVAISTVSIAYEADLPKVEEIIKEHLPEIKEAIPQIINGPLYEGVEELADSGVIIRIVAEVKERDRLSVNRLMNREIKVLLDKYGIHIPFPQVVVHKAQTEDLDEKTGKQEKKD